MRNDSWDICIECKGKEPHQHRCLICLVDYSCSQNPCYMASCTDVTCNKHSKEEAQAFFEKRIKEDWAKDREHGPSY